MRALEPAVTSSPAALPCAPPTHARAQALLRLWEDAAHETGGLPSRRRFAFETMRPWVGHVAIWAVERDPMRFRAALIGTQLVDWDGCDGTGRYLDEIISVGHRDSAIARCALVANSGSWYADAARFVAYGTRTRTLHRLLVPCAEDRITVDHVITAIFRDD